MGRKYRSGGKAPTLLTAGHERLGIHHVVMRVAGLKHDTSVIACQGCVHEDGYCSNAWNHAMSVASHALGSTLSGTKRKAQKTTKQ
jgi:hypothetical protein